MKTEKISKMAMWILMGIAVVVLVCFFAIGMDATNDEGQNEPQCMELLMWTMYIYVLVLAVFTIGNLALAVTKFRDSGLIRVITYCGGSIILYIIFRLICGGQEVPEGATYTADDMALAEAYIYTIYVLFVIAAVVAFVCASGVLMKSATPKK